ncbi:MAG: uroporphyrinogen-III synthase [Sphingomonas bacterium]
MTRPLAVLRPEPGNTATADRIEALGLQPIRLPLFAVRALSWTPPDPADHDALLLTSANALRFAGLDLADLLSLPVLAVGEKTAESARLAGFDVMAAGNTDSAAMLALASARGLSRVLHLGGRDRAIEPNGPVTRAIPVYASEEVPVAAERIERLRGATALLHSARAAAGLGALVDTHGIARSEIAIAALSLAVAAAAGTGWAAIAIAAAPTDAALIAAACTRD